MASPAMTRETVTVAVLVVKAVLTRVLSVLRRLSTSDEGGQLANIPAAHGRLLRGLRLIRLRLIVRLVLAALVIRRLATVRLGLLARRVGRLLIVEILRRVLLVAEIRLPLLRGLALRRLTLL